MNGALLSVLEDKGQINGLELKSKQPHKSAPCSSRSARAFQNREYFNKFSWHGFQAVTSGSSS